MRKADIVYSLSTIALGVFAGLYALQYRSIDRNIRIGADFFPIIMAGGLILTGVVILTGAVRRRDAPGGRGGMETIVLGRVALVGAVLVAYLLLIKPVGFLIDSAALVAFCMVYLGCRRWRAVAIYSVVLPSLVFVLFYYIMYVNLPLGVLESILPKF